MNASGTAFEGYVIADDNVRGAVEERMSGFHTLKLGTDDSSDYLIVVDLCGGHSRFVKSVGHNIIFVARLNEAVIKGRTYTDGHVAGQSPGGGGPYYKISVIKVGAKSLKLSKVVGHLKFNIDGMAGILGIFDLGLGQSGIALRAPVDRFKSLIDVSLVGHFGKDLDLSFLKIVGQSDIGIVPFAYSAKPLKLVALTVYIGKRKIAADVAELGIGNGGIGGNSRLCACLKLGGKSVGIPAGHIRCLKSRHIFIADDKIL